MIKQRINQVIKKNSPKINLGDPPLLRGFSLIELIVALAVFSIVSLSATGIFVSALQAQRRIFAMQNIQENGRFLMESMSKEIRMSQINSSNGSNLDITNAKGEHVIYSFDGATLKRNNEILNSSKVKINGSFYAPGPGSQDRVTITMLIEAIGPKPEEQAKLNLQTTVSSRAY